MMARRHKAARANMAKDAEIFAQKLEANFMVQLGSAWFSSTFLVGSRWCQEVEAMQKSMEYVEKRCRLCV